MKPFALYILIIIPYLVEGQNLKKLYDEAEHAIQYGNYSSAIEYYKDILKIEENIPHVSLRLGIAYFQNLQYKEAELIFKEIATNHSKTYPEAFFYLAEVQTLFGNYTDARYNYSMYIASHSKNEYMNAKAKHELLSEKKIENTDLLENFHLDTIVQLMQAYGVYSYNNNIIYNGIYLVGDSIRGNANFYTFNSSHTTLQEFLPQNSYHISDFCDIGDTILFTIRNTNDTISQSNIYYICSDSLSSGSPKPYISNIFPSEYSSIHFQTFYIDTCKYIIFSSNRPGGYGEMDLWISKRVNHSFMPAINVGSTINTQGNEICPFYDSIQNGIYFSSNWHNSLGGFDVFFSQKTSDSWEQTKNMGAPINSSFNEYYYKIIDSIAYVVSNRKTKQHENSEYYFNSVYKHPIIAIKKPEKKYSIDSLSQTKETMFFRDTVFTFYLFFDNNQPQKITIESSYNDLFTTYFLSQDSIIATRCNQMNYIEKQVCINEMKAFFRHAESQFCDFTELSKKIEESQNIVSLQFSLQASTSNLGSLEANQIIANNRLSAISTYLKNEFSKYSKINSKNITIITEQSIIKCVSGENSILYPKQEAEQRYVKIEIQITEKL